MAATGPDRCAHGRCLLLCAAWLLSVQHLPGADHAAELHTQLEAVATSLTAGNWSDAMGSFSKSFPKYDQLRDDFEGLTNSFAVSNEVDVLDEDDADTEIKATIKWSITLSNPQNNFSVHRVADINMRLIREKKKWKIIEFAPFEIFSPAADQAPAAKPPG